MKLKIFIFFLLLNLTAYSQTKTENSSSVSSNSGLTKEELSFACDAYKKMIQSTTYIENEEKVRFMAKKISGALKTLDPNNLPVDSLKTHTLFLKWIEKNIKKTSFKSFDEAKFAFEEQVKSSEKLKKENQKLFDLIDKATQEQRVEIYQPFFNTSSSEIYREKSNSNK